MPEFPSVTVACLQKARQQLAESLLHRPVAKSPSPTPVTPDITPEVGR